LSLAYLGTSEFAAGVLAGLEPAPDLVVSRPDRPAGRGRRLSAPPVVRAAREMGLAVEQPEDVHALDLTPFDDVVVCAFGVFIREPLISHPGLVNVHPSLLPRWRGAAPIERAIMAGDRETGVCLMEVAEELDAGGVFLRAVEPIADDDTYGSLSERLVAASVELLRRYFSERPVAVEQGTEGMVYAEKIGAADRRLDPAQGAVENERVVRALNPHVGAKAGAGGGGRAGAARAPPPPPGELHVEGARVLWGCADGALDLLEVQPPGKRRMPAAAYARGH
jgi:methionyl-tRNA formyltransferase